jgi:hypothetical protein
MAEFEDKVKAAFDAEFERTRPRPGLRQRVVANAVATSRVQRPGIRAWLTPPRLATLAAAAAFVVVIGVGVRLATSTPSAAVLAFGKLPAPGLHPANGLGAGGGTAPTILPYFGPATMTWAGQLPKVPLSTPVYRFAVPSIADEDAFAVRLGATPPPAGSTGEPRSYSGPGDYVMSIAADPVVGEPTYRLRRQAGPSPNQPLTDDAAHAAADAELARLGLRPSWRSTVQVSRLNQPSDQAPIFVVQYQRLIPLGGGAVAPEVDGNGDPAGIRVLVDSGGHILEISGTLPLAEQPATYPLRAASTAVTAAVAATPVTNESGSVPVVRLTHATLVYTTVRSGGVGYLEPAYLFTGQFTRDGYRYEKRVLVPALAPNAVLGP